MMGTEDNPGVNRRAVRELLQFVTDNQGNIDFTITLSLMEIYNENIYDLLSPKQSEKLSIHQGPTGNTYVSDLSEFPIQTQV